MPLLHNNPISMAKLNQNIDDDLWLAPWHILYTDRISGLNDMIIELGKTDSYMQLYGGKYGTIGSGGKYELYGGTRLFNPGGHIWTVPNAAKNANLTVMQLPGVIDTPYLDMQSHNISSLADPVDVQDAVTKHYAENHLAASMLTDYATNTFTPIIAFGGASVGITYTTQAGCYTRIGNVVTVSGYIVLSNKGTSVGAATIGALPFTVNNQFGAYSAAAVELRVVSFSIHYSAFAAINTTTIVLGEETAAGVWTVLADTDFANTSRVIFSCTYRV